jgi:hypothetical protein
VPRARRISLSAALVVAALASAAPAQAGTPYELPPARSGVYGGGALLDYLHFVALRVASDGTLTTDAKLVTKCAPKYGDELTESISVKKVQLDASGGYSATTSFSDRVDRGVPLTGGLFAKGTILFSAHVGVDGLARGTARVRTRYSRSEGGAAVSTCDTGSIRWTARRPAADAGRGRSRLQPGTHRGTTADDEPFLMRVTRRGRLVRRAGLTVHVDCPSVTGMALDVVAQRVSVRRGAFSKAGGFELPYTYRNGMRVLERYRWVLHGRFGSRGARGTFALNGVVRRRSNGRPVTSCATGTVAWRASR